MNFELTLKENNLKATHQRLVILTEIYKAGHIDLDSLFNKIRKKFPTIALATLYRNLSDMASRHILSEVKIPRSKNVFEIRKPEHIHLVCEKCGKIEDLDQNVQDLFANVPYKITKVDVHISGICSNCLKKQTSH